MSNWTKLWLFIKSALIKIGECLLFVLAIFTPYLIVVGVGLLGTRFEMVGRVVVSIFIIFFFIGGVSLIASGLRDLWRTILREYRDQKKKEELKDEHYKS